MRSLFFVCFFILTLPFSGLAQLEVNKTEHHFGNLRKGDKTTVDFLLKNTSDKEIFLMRATSVRHVEVRYTNRTIQPDSTVVLRVHFSPRKKGYFTERIHLFESSSTEKTTFTIDGRVLFAPTGEGTPCPDFNLQDQYERLDFEAQFTVLDTFSRNPIEGAKLKIIRNGKIYGTSLTDENGRTWPKVRTGGPYWFVVTADGYKTKEFDRYMNKANSRLNILMVPITEDTPDQPVVTIIEDPVQDIIIEIPMDDPVVDEPIIDDPVVDEPIVDTTTTTTPPIASTTYEPWQLDPAKYKPNNIIFLIDLSSSMNQKGRLELLKASMIELLTPLRDIDQITIVTYSSGADVVMRPRPASNKAEIINIIENLNAGGSTQGGKGLRMAYGVAKKHFIEGGNNQVIIATDGAFSDTQTNHPGIVKRNARRGIRLSVVGVVNESWTAKSMRAMAKNGNGHYFRIEDYETAKALLVAEIKLNSLRN